MKPILLRDHFGWNHVPTTLSWKLHLNKINSVARVMTIIYHSMPFKRQTYKILTVQVFLVKICPPLDEWTWSNPHMVYYTLAMTNVGFTVMWITMKCILFYSKCNFIVYDRPWVEFQILHILTIILTKSIKRK